MLQEIDFCDRTGNSSDIDREDVYKILPNRNTKIFKIELKNGLKYVTLHTNCTTKKDIKSWISEYEDNTGASYSITNTKDCSGRYVIFKQFLKCHHNTRHKNVCLDNKSRSKNTKCPAAITVTLRSYNNKRKENDKDRMEKAKLPCIFYLVTDHNHDTNDSALNHRKVSAETREELIKLFKSGHTPATALQILKNDLFLIDNSEKILSDRKYCPDYNFCHHLYKKFLKQEYATISSEDGIKISKDLGAKISAGIKRKKDLGAIVSSGAKKNKKLDSTSLSETKTNEDGGNASSSEGGFKVIDHITLTLRQTLRRFYVQSPEQMGPVLQKMSENVKKLRSRASVVSACSNFASEKRARPKAVPKPRRKKIQAHAPPQPSFTSPQWPPQDMFMGTFQPKYPQNNIQ